jgi:hypothetical protein
MQSGDARMVLGALFAVSVIVSSVACLGGNCSHNSPGVDVNFGPGLTSDDIATITVSGACGPVPSPLCDPKLPRCVAVDGWDLYVPSDTSGACAVHVVLKDGEVFDDSVTVSHSTGCGVDGYYGDHVVLIRSKSADAGSID